jgi:uncharacterized protein (TIGR00299 family) protein
MKTLYIECAMGAAGDMLMAALVELLPEPGRMIDRLNGLGIPGTYVQRQAAVKCGITGTHISVTVKGEEEESLDAHDHSPEQDHHHDEAASHDHDHTHEHAGMGDITQLISGLPVSQAVKTNALDVYNLLAEAEAHVHGRPVEQVHFHEVGTMDAVADIVGVCLLMEELAPDRVVVSPIHVGSGQVRCAHGILPVPAPATAYLLRGIPTYGGSIRGELCTPTGAAILKHFANEFGSMPVMRVQSIGYGMGKKDFEAANCVRAMLGTADDPFGPNGEIVQLSCNLDDMTGEAMGYAQQLLLDRGALDVFTVPIPMKKFRPAYMLVCLCKPQDANQLAQAMLKHTTTFGVRSEVLKRYMLDRHMDTVKTPWGPVRRKTGEGYGTRKCKYEYDDAAAIASRHNLSMNEVYRELYKESGSEDNLVTDDSKQQ